MCRGSSFILCLCILLPAATEVHADEFLLERILQRFTEAYVGFRDVDALSSLSVEGEIEQNGQVFDFLMRKKRPSSMRYRLSNGSHQVVIGFNGTKAWIRREGNEKSSIQAMDPVDTQALRIQAQFDSPLYRHTAKSENTIKLIEQLILDGQLFYVLSVDEPSRHRCIYYLDADTAYITRVDQLDANNNIQFQTLYRDYKKVEGYPFAHEIETRVDEKRTSLATVNVIEVNPGLLSFYFEEPAH